MKIRVCVPFYSDYEVAQKGLDELESCIEHEFIIEERQGTYIDNLRNHLINDGKSIKKFQKPLEGFDAFLTVDTDIGFTLKDVLILVKHIQDGLNIVSLPYLRQGDPNKIEYECHKWKHDLDGNIVYYYKNTERGFKKIDSCGAGMMLIHRKVFENMEYPWYRRNLISHNDCQTVAGEDISFCMGAKKYGFDIWCDFDYPVYHKLREKLDFNWRRFRKYK